MKELNFVWLVTRWDNDDNDTHVVGGFSSQVKATTFMQDLTLLEKAKRKRRHSYGARSIFRQIMCYQVDHADPTQFV